ncbi:hypothetical protein J4207_04825 [Candidatus Woesearchaeota archaeon]|nr:hypothetical protein [Candidatus Woesearchaeota archaeon]
MKDITKAEMNIVLTLVKSPEVDYNANNIAKKVGITAMGALKILKRLEKEDIVISKKMGNASFYQINFTNDYAVQYVKLLIKREVAQAEAYVRVWISDIKKLKSADAAILFGSVLTKGNKANDIDVVLITDQQRFEKLKKEIDELAILSQKRIHPVFQAMVDVERNIKKKDPVILNAIKGIVAFGEDIVLKTLNDTRGK